MSRHLPALWKFRLLRTIHAKGNYSPNRELLDAWAKAEGGSAAFNPLNTTEPWPGATDYNTAGVKNYPNGAAGIAATAKTLTNGFYDGIVADLRQADKSSCRVVHDRRAEFDKWGTGAASIARVLGCKL